MTTNQPNILPVSSFDNTAPSSDDKCKLELLLNQVIYSPGSEIVADIKLSVTSTMANVKAISWQLYGAEMLQRSEGYLSRHVIINETQYLVGDESSLEESAPDKEEEIHILEPTNFFWEAKCKLPEKAPPTFRTNSARIEYYFKVHILRKAEEDLEIKELIPVVSKFPEDCDLNEEVVCTKSETMPAGGFLRMFSPRENKLKMVTTTNLYHFCPFGMENPCISMHLQVTSDFNEVIRDMECIVWRKTILHHKDMDVNESLVVCRTTIPLIPPLQEGESKQEYYVQIPVSNSGRFVNPSRFSSRCVFNEYFVETIIKTVATKACICISTWNDNPHPLVAPEKIQLKKEKEQRKLKEEVETWTAEQVQSWLDDNQLESLKEKFLEQSIDGAALLSLEEKYFPTLGVTKVGDIIKLNKALTSLKD